MMTEEFGVPFIVVTRKVETGYECQEIFIAISMNEAFVDEPFSIGLGLNKAEAARKMEDEYASRHLGWLEQIERDFWKDYERDMDEGPQF